MSSFSAPVIEPSSPVVQTKVKPLNLEKIDVTLPDGKMYTYPRPLRLQDLIKNHAVLQSPTIVAFMVNGRVYSLNSTIYTGNAAITPIELNSYEGSSIYRRSLVMLYATAVNELYGEKFSITIEHHVNNGYLSKKRDETNFTEEEIKAIKEKMLELVKAEKPFTEVYLSSQEAVNYLTTTKRDYTVKLIESLSKDEVKCSCCDNFLTLFVRPLAANTKILTDFDVRLSSDKTSLLLLFPIGDKKIPEKLEDIETKLISKSYKESSQLGKITGIECIGDLNMKINSGDSRFLLSMENRQDMQISRIAEEAADKVKNHGVKFIGIAGPSASGKTTFSKKLGVQLKVRGITPVILSIDDYYKHRLDSPKDAFGNYDFECLEALRVDDFNRDLLKLFNGEEIHRCIFDFVSGRYSYLEDETLTLPPNGCVVVEGLHGIDENLTPQIPRDQKYYIFIAPLTALNIDEYNFIGNQVLRFYRRIVRDFMTRNYSASKTLKNWFTVAKGEEKYIFPYVAHADTIWNSSMEYETSAIYPYVYPLLKTVKVDDPNYNMACYLLDCLELFLPIDDHKIASTSLIREFIGGSAFE